MKIKSLIALSCALFSVVAVHAAPTSITLSSAPAGRTLSLNEAYDLALKRSDALAQQEEGLKQIDARIREEVSAVLPQINFYASEFVQEKANTDKSNVASTLTRPDQPLVKLTGHQTLFTGFRDLVAIKAIRLQGAATGLLVKRAKDLLYQDVAASYVQLLQLQEEIDTRRAVWQVTNDRVKELSDRERVGRSRKSENLAARSRLAQIDADILTVVGQEKIAQDQLKFLTGLDEDIRPVDLPIPAGQPIDAFLAKAKEREDVEAQRQNLEASKYFLSAAKRERIPVIGVDGNYYLKRTGFQRDINWDATFAATLPLYSGGAVSSRIREAESVQKQSGFALSQAQRTAELQIRTAYRDFSTALSIVDPLQKATDLADANAKAQSADYRLGLVTNLDVLDSLSAMQETRLRLNQAKLQTVLAFIRLQVSSGARP